MAAKATLQNNVRGDDNSQGGAVHINGGTFTMNGGTIRLNEAVDGGGVYLNSGTFTMNGGTIGGPQDADKNTAVRGGGVYIAGGNFDMPNASTGTISHNTTTGDGGGVYKDGSGTFYLRNGTIDGNKASGSGGGVYIANFSVIMSGGLISNNVASGTYGGGGVWVSATFIMTGGTISQNIYTRGRQGNEGGNGVRVQTGKSFQMSGSARIIENEVYLLNEKITITGPLDNNTVTLVSADNSGRKDILKGTSTFSLTQEIVDRFSLMRPPGAIDGTTYTLVLDTAKNIAEQIQEP
jgi:hypothetical protein